jgi:outer membrane protein assembly factor BamB
MRRILPLLLVGWLSTADVRAHDWAKWRGPEQNGVSREKDLPDRFSLDPNAENSNLIWKAPYGGRSTPLVMNGRVFLIDDAGEGETEQERVVCFDAETGKVLWERRFNVFQCDIVSNRVGWTNLAGDPETGNIYAHGVQGLLQCYSRDGDLLWYHSLTEEYGRITGYGGRTTSPTVDGDLVIIGMVNASWGEQARPGDRYLALDKRTGIPVWWSDSLGMRGTYYSCPVIAVINGERLLITGGSDGGLHALKVRTGESIWSYQVGARALNSSPVVDGTHVYISHGEENEGTNEQGRVLCVDAAQVKDGKPALVWKVDGIRAGYASPILHEGRLYVCDDGAKMHCLDAKTGQKLWRRPFKYGTVAKGSPLWADGKIYVNEVSSKFHILKPGPKDCEELFTYYFRSPEGTVIELNGTPSAANGRIYFTTHDEIFCIGKKNHQATPGPLPIGVNEPLANPADKPAHLQVVPADIPLYPGQSIKFQVYAYDAHGRKLGEIPAATVSWSIQVPPPPPGSKESPPPLRGQVNGEGLLVVDSQVQGQQGAVLTKLGNLTGRARVRVVPKLSYTQDFEKVPEGRTPGGWINTQGKYAVAMKDGSKTLKKLGDNTNPVAARGFTYMGMPNWTDYTIQADLLGSRPAADLPDMGLVNCRYTLFFDGNKQLLRLATWEAWAKENSLGGRVEKTIKYAWEPNVWYRFKLHVEVKGAKAVVQGKVWPRNGEEPKAWTIEIADPVPNREGSPALYCWAKGIEGQPGAEIFYDNLRITPNSK